MVETTVVDLEFAKCSSLKLDLLVGQSGKFSPKENEAALRVA